MQIDSRFNEFVFPYFDDMKYFCLKNCFYQYMNYLGIEDSLLKLKTGFKFKIVYFAHNQSFSVFKHDLLLPFYDMNNAISGNGDDFNSIFEENLNSLPVIVLADVFYLPYREEYKKYHASHAIFLTGYSEKEKIVHIIDWYSPYFFKGTIDFENYKLARGSANPKDVNPFSGFEINNYWYKITTDKMNIDSEFNIIENLNSMKAVECNGQEKAILTGVNALNKVIEVSELYLQVEERDLKKVCSYLHDELFVWYRASALSKVFYQEAHSKYKNLISEELLQFINEGSEMLNSINYFLMKGSMARSRKNLENSVEGLKKFRKLYTSIL